MLDINLIRKDPEIIKESLKRRKDPEKIKWLDDLTKLDKESLKLKKQIEELRHKRNTISLEINKLKKQKQPATKEIKLAKELPKKINDLEEKQSKIKEKINHYLMRLPNIMHKSVPYGKDENENKVIRKWGKIPKTQKLDTHANIVEKHYPKSFTKASEVAGKGFYYLFDKIALLERALINYSIDFLTKKGYMLCFPPQMLRRKSYEGVTDLADFENMLYKIEGEDLYLIATSEHPIAAFYQNETLKKKDLPIKIAGYSTCFRKEIGSHGVDERGLFRVHQFNKVEQFIFCDPKDSWKYHEELLKNAEEITKKLKIPYRVVNICTGDLGIVASKKYDIEAYMPREKEYKEIISCSNCTSYQAARLKIKYLEGNEKKHIHTLNSTALATARMLRAILENYQQKDGSIKVPIVLQKYMNNIKVIK
ncbi:serine--tRNA ligase [archaeon]|nr:serine--tRNA ligase [archaeon]